MDRATRSSSCRERLARSPRRTARSSSILHKLLQSQSKCRARRRRSASFLQGLQFSFSKPTNRRLVSPRTEAVTVVPIPKCLCLRGICHTVPRHSAWRPVNRPQPTLRCRHQSDCEDWWIRWGCHSRSRESASAWSPLFSFLFSFRLNAIEKDCSVDISRHLMVEFSHAASSRILNCHQACHSFRDFSFRQIPLNPVFLVPSSGNWPEDSSIRPSVL